MEHVEKRTHEYLKSLTTQGLKRTYSVKNDDGTTIRVTAQDILIHMFEEEVDHRGELNALLWQMGIEPPANAVEGPLSACMRARANKSSFDG